jgi:hypothetical protein
MTFYRSSQYQESRRKSGGIGKSSLSGSGRLPLPARCWRDLVDVLAPIKKRPKADRPSESAFTLLIVTVALEALLSTNSKPPQSQRNTT